MVFRVEGNHAVLSRAAYLLEMAGTVPVPPIQQQQRTDWSEIREQTLRDRAVITGAG